MLGTALLALSVLLAPSVSRGPAAGIDPDELIRRVVKAQRHAEQLLAGATFDQREIHTTYGKTGRPEGTESRLFYVFSGDHGEESTRELVQVNGRLATPDEQRKAAAEDEKGRKKRIEQRAAAKAAAPPLVTGDEDDPLVGRWRLSDLMHRFVLEVAAQDVVEGRPVYVVRFQPRPGKEPVKLGERALTSLAGTAVIDAIDFHIRSIAAHLVRPVKVAGGLAANVKEGEVAYEGRPLAHGGWFPCRVDVRLKGKTALFFRLDSGYRFEFGNFRRFRVDAEAAVSSR